MNAWIDLPASTCHHPYLQLLLELFSEHFTGDYNVTCCFVLSRVLTNPILWFLIYVQRGEIYHNCPDWLLLLQQQYTVHNWLYHLLQEFKADENFVGRPFRKIHHQFSLSVEKQGNNRHRCSQQTTWMRQMNEVGVVSSLLSLDCKLELWNHSLPYAPSHKAIEYCSCVGLWYYRETIMCINMNS